jgi:hypothetical protein
VAVFSTASIVISATSFTDTTFTSPFFTLPAQAAVLMMIIKSRQGKTTQRRPLLGLML